MAQQITRLNALSDRLLHLGREQELAAPYNSDPSLVYVITGPDQIEDGNEAWKLSPTERAIINHLRLSGGQPVLHAELLPYLYRTTRKGKLTSLTDTLNQPKGLNAAIGEDPAERLIVTDRCRPSLVRLGHAITFIDERPRLIHGDVSRYRKRFAHLSTAVPLPPGLPRREGNRPVQHLKELHYPALQSVGSLALKRAVVSLRDMYALSLRYGPLDPLRDTLLPLADGRRIAYNELFPADGAYPEASSRKYLQALLQVTPSCFTESIIGVAMTKILELDSRHPIESCGC